MTQTQDTYKLVSPTTKTRCVCFIVKGDDVWVHYYGSRSQTQAESIVNFINPETGKEVEIRANVPVSRDLAKAVWNRFVECGFVRG